MPLPLDTDEGNSMAQEERAPKIHQGYVLPVAGLDEARARHIGGDHRSAPHWQVPACGFPASQLLVELLESASQVGDVRWKQWGAIGQQYRHLTLLKLNLRQVVDGQAPRPSLRDDEGILAPELDPSGKGERRTPEQFLERSW